MADRYQYQQLAFVDFSVPVEIITMDKWFMETSVPIFRIDRNNSMYPVTAFLDIEASLAVGGIPSLASIGVGF